MQIANQGVKWPKVEYFLIDLQVWITDWEWLDETKVDP